MTTIYYLRRKDRDGSMRFTLTTTTNVLYTMNQTYVLTLPRPHERQKLMRLLGRLGSAKIPCSQN